MKERAVFYLDRYVAKLETAHVDHEKMAEQCFSYVGRNAGAAKAALDIEKTKHELDTIRWIRAQMIGV